MQTIRDEAKRYFDLGLNVHWLRKNSKAPLEEGWAGRPKRKWSELKASYSKDLGVGVQTGNAAEISGGLYLAMLDVDQKSKSSHHIDESFAEVNRLFQNAFDTAPCVKSPNGVRYLFLTKNPMASRKLLRSSERVKVKLPTDRATESARKRAIDSGDITAKEWDKGYRIRPAWEIELMSTGKQGVLPPTIHPDTGVPYEWLVPLNDIADLPIIGNKKIQRALERAGVSEEDESHSSSTDTVPFKFTPTDVDLECSIAPASLVRMIADGINEDGTPVPDGSAGIYSAAMHLKRLQFTDDEILTILTDEAYALGRVAYEHTGSKKRWRAARWVEKYTLRKAAYNVSPEKAFAEDPLPVARLDKEAKEKQAKEIKKNRPWQIDLKRKAVSQAAADRGEQGAIISSVENVVLILENDIAGHVFKRDDFSVRDLNGVHCPWELGEEGIDVTDESISHMKLWLAKKWGIEPATDKLNEAVVIIATRNAFNPFRDWLEALPAWDGVERIPTFFADNFGAEEKPEYLGELFRKWLIASITRVYKPGTKFDHMPILQGKPGLYKSSFGRILFGEQWYTDSVPEKLDTADAALVLKGKAVVEFSEMGHFNKNSIEIIRQYIVRLTDHVRPPYGRRHIKMHRHNVFYGTTNARRYLLGEPTDRRFCPLTCLRKANAKKLEKDREQIWAEAMFYYMNECEDLFLSEENEAYATSLRKGVMVETTADFMANAIEEWLKEMRNSPENLHVKLHRFSVFELFDDAKGPLRKWASRGDSLRQAAQALYKLDFENKKSGGNKYWKGPEKLIMEFEGLLFN